jgi:hypothetical protein
MEVFFVKPREPDPPQPPPRRKHVMTPARLDAAKANAQKSSGPKDTTNTRFNGIKHGCCCELPVVMPGEDAEEIQNKIKRYNVEQRAETEAERDTIELAVMSLVKAKRGNKADVAAATRVVNAVTSEFEDRQGLRLADLIANLAAAPAATVIQLEQFTHGISWALGQVQMLEQHLSTRPGCGLHPDQRVRGIHIFGKQPQDLFTDPVVMDWNFLYISALHGPGPISGEDAAELLATDRPEGMELDHFERRLGEAMRNLLHRQEARARLQQLLARYKADLLQRFDDVAQREAIDLDLAIEEAMVPVNADSMKRLRYQRENERGYQAGMRLLHQMQLMRLKYGPALGAASAIAPTEASAAAATGPPEGAPSPPATAQEVVHRTEAAATQVAGGTRSTSDAGGPSTRSASVGGREDANPSIRGLDAVPQRPGMGDFVPLKE